MSHEERKALIVPDPDISLVRQTELLGISRGSLYYTGREKCEDKKHLDMIDAIYIEDTDKGSTDYPFYGSRRVRNELLDRYGVALCREHVQRLMRLLGIEAIYPKPRTSTAHPEHKKYPYLLKNLAITHPNHVWGTDITYIRLEDGWAYLVAIIDWYSRYVLSWELSLSMETDFCTAALNRALSMATPEIHNSDQGVQFTDKEYVGRVEASGAAVSMDGRGRCMDDIFTERLWRTVKYENVFLKSYRNVTEANTGLTEYFSFYNTRRRHQSLEYRTPESIYFGKS